MSGENLPMARASAGQPHCLVATKFPSTLLARPDKRRIDPGIVTLSFHKRAGGSAWNPPVANSQGHPVRACPIVG